jgi:hypothetical protein
MSDVLSGTDADARARDGRPLLLCLSHLRWDFVFQRPQHLLTRAAQGYDVVFFQEPVSRPGADAPRLERRRNPEGVTVAVPVLPEGMAGQEAAGAMRALLDGLLAPEAGRPLVAWFYTPTALEFAGHLAPDVTVYDCMDELSAFRGATATRACSASRLPSTPPISARRGRRSPTRRTRTASLARASASSAWWTSAWTWTSSTRWPSCAPTGGS